MKKLICAPMATLSHEAFRRTVESIGSCDEYFTEMINAASLINMGPFEKFYLLNGPCPEKIVWQLTSNDIDKFSEAVNIIMPYKGIGIDINMGCSAPQIYKTGAGIAWMLKPLSETKKLIRSVKDQIDKNKSTLNYENYRLSVKCRLGGEDFTEESFFKFTDTLVDEGVELITLHPRTQKEKYRGMPKYQWVEKLVNRYNNKIEVYLNGNIKDLESLNYAQNISPSCSGFMIGRAATTKPWIFDQLVGNHQSLDRQKIALDFIQNVLTYQPEAFWKTRIQRFFFYYCEQFQYGHYFQTKMLNYKSPEESRKEVLDYFEKQKEERFITY